MAKKPWYDPAVRERGTEREHLSGVDLMKLMFPGGRGERKKEAAKAVAPKRRQTVQDYLYYRDPKETSEEALNKLSAGELGDLLSASEEGVEGVDVTKGDAKLAFDAMWRKEREASSDKLLFDYKDVPEVPPYFGYKDRPGQGGREEDPSAYSPTFPSLMKWLKPAREEEPDVGTLW